MAVGYASGALGLLHPSTGKVLFQDKVAHQGALYKVRVGYIVCLQYISLCKMGHTRWYP